MPPHRATERNYLFEFSISADARHPARGTLRLGSAGVQRRRPPVKPAEPEIHPAIVPWGSRYCPKLAQMRRDQVIDARRELHLRQMAAAGEHDETSVRQRDSQQFGIRYRRRDEVFLALNHQQGHRQPRQRGAASLPRR